MQGQGNKDEGSREGSREARSTIFKYSQRYWKHTWQPWKKGKPCLWCQIQEVHDFYLAKKLILLAQSKRLYLLARDLTLTMSHTKYGCDRFKNSNSIIFFGCQNLNFTILLPFFWLGSRNNYFQSKSLCFLRFKMCILRGVLLVTLHYFAIQSDVFSPVVLHRDHLQTDEMKDRQNAIDNAEEAFQTREEEIAKAEKHLEDAQTALKKYTDDVAQNKGPDHSQNIRQLNRHRNDKKQEVCPSAINSTFAKPLSSLAKLLGILLGERISLHTNAKWYVLKN